MLWAPETTGHGITHTPPARERGQVSGGEGITNVCVHKHVYVD